ncbi:MAG TPA: hypothetical protein VKE40_01260 [Gemmataceae bacterium]|nr:hypothetical protein [Gemmataceae bacterium]
MFRFGFAALWAAVSCCACGRAEEYKGARVVKCAVTGEMTIEFTTGGKKQTAAVWPYDRMKCYDEAGKEILPALISKEGTVLDLSTSQEVLKGYEVILEAKIVKRPKKDDDNKPDLKKPKKQD